MYVCRYNTFNVPGMVASFRRTTIMLGFVSFRGCADARKQKPSHWLQPLTLVGSEDTINGAKVMMILPRDQNYISLANRGVDKL